ncbi:hypothetical protein LTR28_004366 [Elasticomyces elasticus]|nr:hypothetical protein LTR28_004366 [Elasticomyces elasticus]
MSSPEKHEDPPAENDQKLTMANNEDDTVYPSGLKLIALMSSFFLGVFMVSLDKLIVSTAIPQITNDFNSTDDIGWYGTAYLLTNAAFQLLFGKLYKFMPIKTTFIASLFLFEVGSALCGAAPNSMAFILGRAIAGVGAGGVMSGVMVVLVYCIPLEARPRMQGLSGAIFGVSLVLGPTLSGAFTSSKATWRWCFYINLPMGAVTMVLVFFLLQIPVRPTSAIPLKEKLKQLNLMGLAALVPGVVALCLALQWGGSTYAIWKPAQATVPPKIFMQRSIASGFWAIQGKTAVQSGTYLLPMVLLIVVGFIANGELTTRLGYYVPSLIIGTSLTALGAGFMNTFAVHTPKGKWIGYEILYGFGVGLAGQVPNMAAQTVLPKEDVAIGASLMFFGQTLFAAIFISIGQNVLSKELLSRLPSVPGIDARLIQSTGATDLLRRVPEQYHDLALGAYNGSLRAIFQIGLCLACIQILGAFGMEWLVMKPKFPPKNKKVAGPGIVEPGKDEKDVTEKGIFCGVTEIQAKSGASSSGVATPARSV